MYMYDYDLHFWIVGAAIIDFSLTQAWLLIEGKGWPTFINSWEEERPTIQCTLQEASQHLVHVLRWLLASSHWSGE